LVARGVRRKVFIELEITRFRAVNEVVKIWEVAI